MATPPPPAAARILSAAAVKSQARNNMASFGPSPAPQCEQKNVPLRSLSSNSETIGATAHRAGAVSVHQRLSRHPQSLEDFTPATAVSFTERDAIRQHGVPPSASSCGRRSPAPSPSRDKRHPAAPKCHAAHEARRRTCFCTGCRPSPSNSRGPRSTRAARNRTSADRCDRASLASISAGPTRRR